ERQAERPGDEPGGLVERVAGAMAERDAGALQPLGRGNDQLDQGHRRLRGSAHELLEGRAVDVLEHVQAGDLDLLVDLVDAGVDRTELDDLLAHARDEAAVGRPAAGRELGLDAGMAADRARERVAERAWRGQERLAA